MNFLPEITVKRDLTQLYDPISKFISEWSRRVSRLLISPRVNAEDLREIHTTHRFTAPPACSCRQLEVQLVDDRLEVVAEQLVGAG